MFNGLAFLNKDENDFDNITSGAASNEQSNLADIFDVDDSVNSTEANPTLKYIPPKPKQLREQKTVDKSIWNVVIAKIVRAFKLNADTNTTEPLGQMGIALLQNPAGNVSKLIIYRTKENILSSFFLTQISKVYWKPPYLQYHDDMKVFWSIIFGNDSDCSDFFTKLEIVCKIDRNDVSKSESSDVNKVKVINDIKDIKAEIVYESKSDESKKIDKEKTDETDTFNNTTKKIKSDVVYRVAKIGHQLPKIKPVADDDSDSTLPSDTERVPKTVWMKSSSINIPDKSMAIAPTQLPPKPTNISVALQPSYWQSSTFDLNSLATENRMQNTEVRMNMSKLDSKLDKVLDNIERLRLNSLNPSNVTDKEEEIIKLEEKVLELKKENRALKQQVNDSEQKVKDTTKQDNKELIALYKETEAKDIRIEELEIMEQHLKKEIDLKNKEMDILVENHSTELNSVRDELNKKSTELETLQQQYQQQLQQQQQQEQEQQSNKSGNSSNGEVVRSIMNTFYANLYESIDGKESMKTADILKLTAEIIRKETKAALNSN